ncbi:trophoblast glycoprotein-like [Patiria miniata]|uniref:LRRCT domain-containing protein n=1 Tax=Patiria miniata TaxID=46514 RepID=A0A913Z931_PATMI|nr:trophoblast glycoprotein-like [Patiria miniata]
MACQYTSFIFSLVVTLSLLAGAVQAETCRLPTRPRKCSCSGTALKCNRWPTWEKVAQNTTSLTISGETTVTELTTDNKPSKALPHLTALILTGNNISYIEEGWFSQTVFAALEEIILDQNKLTPNDTQRMFADVSTNLRLLSLTKAFLNVTPDDYVHNLTNIFTDVHLTKLRELRLDGNNIGFLSPFVQESSVLTFQELQRFTLHKSSLLAIRSGTFQQKVFPKLQYLDLSNNELVNIDKSVVELDFESFSNVQQDLTIDLSGNPFYCNCRLADFQAWLNATNLVLDKENVTCGDAVDESERHKPVLGSSLPCGPKPEEIDIDNELRPSYIILSVILALVGVLALIVLYMRRNDIKDYFVDLYTTTKEAFNSRQGYDDINRVRRDTPEMAPTEV